MCDPHLRLTRLLRERAGPDATLIAGSARPWASVTFSGARHHLAFAMCAATAGRLTRLSCRDLAIPGHLIADLTLTEHAAQGDIRVVECAALTLEAA